MQTIFRHIMCRRDHHLARSKSGNNYCPISKYIETEFDISDKEILCFQNETLLRKVILMK